MFFLYVVSLFDANCWALALRMARGFALHVHARGGDRKSVV